MGLYDTTLGAISIGYVLAWGLYGVQSTQTFGYFQSFPKDSRWLKILVASLWLLDTLQLAFIGHVLYYWLIMNYGNPASFQVNSIWTFSVGILFTNMIILIVELFLTYRVYLLSDGNLILSSIIFLLSLLFFSFELAAVVRMFQLQKLALFYEFGWISSTGLACASTADILIAVSLCRYLMKSRTGMQTRTDSIVTKLILYAINTGLLTSVVVLMDMICFLTMPNNLVHLSFNIMVGKLYSNSLLATLNFRDTVRKRNKEGITTFSFPGRIQIHEETIITRDGHTSVVPEFAPLDGMTQPADQATIDSTDVADEKRLLHV